VAAVVFVPADLEPFATIEAAKAQAMIDDALALAARIAPCINDEDFAYPGAALAILRSAVLRWNDAGTGAVQTYQVGQVSQGFDNRTPRKSLFWPSEIEALQELCQGDITPGTAFDVDTVGCVGMGHSEVCALYFGADYCSCGAVLTAGLYPLYELTFP
jgi:hypothetical protein